MNVDGVYTLNTWTKNNEEVAAQGLLFYMHGHVSVHLTLEGNVLYSYAGTYTWDHEAMQVTHDTLHRSHDFFDKEIRTVDDLGDGRLQLSYARDGIDNVLVWNRVSK